MDPIVMVVLIVLISVGAGVVNNYLKLKANAKSDKGADEDIRRVLGEVDRLKERVRVLEKIVTDQERQLSDEIRKLA
ncbi:MULTISPECIES: hypothetical protein [unclassified Hyphomonas]|jgi:hypothetical protein|uniref:hypothetical protein n=2 Tax=Hyphomonas TaxID=85 RepID=UPI001F5D0A2F|nr:MULTISPECIES: hypothetical protein [unclassified Hyphomonas]|tara:strand:+ start:339 stop:569 length:231 start_codon:yes stop_codon:yes gene_type:complete